VEHLPEDLECLLEWAEWEWNNSLSYFSFYLTLFYTFSNIYKLFHALLNIQNVISMGMKEKGKNEKEKKDKKPEKDRKPWEHNKERLDEARKALNPFSSQPMEKEKLRKAIGKTNIWEGSLQRPLAGPDIEQLMAGLKPFKGSQVEYDPRTGRPRYKGQKSDSELPKGRTVPEEALTMRRESEGKGEKRITSAPGISYRNPVIDMWDAEIDQEKRREASASEEFKKPEKKKPKTPEERFENFMKEKPKDSS
jgi:hypothetical protein